MLGILYVFIYNHLSYFGEAPIQIFWPFKKNILLSEMSQSVEDKYHMISPIRGT